MPNYDVEFVGIGDDFDRAEIEAKGWYDGAVVKDGRARFSIHFRDPVRLRQDVEADLELDGISLIGQNCVLVPSITRDAMLDAIQRLADRGFVGLTPSDDIDER